VSLERLRALPDWLKAIAVVAVVVAATMLVRFEGAQGAPSGRDARHRTLAISAMGAEETRAQGEHRKHRKRLCDRIKREATAEAIDL
jgi:hypothetical protein